MEVGAEGRRACIRIDLSLDKRARGKGLLPLALSCAPGSPSPVSAKEKRRERETLMEIVAEGQMDTLTAFPVTDQEREPFLKAPITVLAMLFLHFCVNVFSCPAFYVLLAFGDVLTKKLS